MKKTLQLALMFATAFVVARTACAEEVSGDTRTIDARVVRVKLDGMIDLRLRQGSTPSLVIVIDKRYTGKVTSAQSGDTLHIDTESGSGKVARSSVRAELVLPALREVTSDGVGSTDISGFTGDDLTLSLEGAGSMKIVADYKKVKASLGGVGSMNIWVSENNNVDLDLQGAGYVTLGGRGKKLSATLGGLGGLNAQQFQADAVDLELSGLGNATVTARTNARLNLSGLGSVTVYGKPANRDVSVDGLGKVSWK
ncbi:GIN domain-containing protein [Janthinobacterium agaricidamnosum]|uniref:Putative auto-transporter adhesin head GIN domain-containing protein n=1 Tax=Janthinobacterium agaricidamnosum NBRC 102515 = DSM 9628 TaxID=1349767 RepID=W0V9G2_9BURK|nr:DUF2807 domain-containing protein [Janthinobacterium agaricidamnosum]CDG83973.1 putative uncharacterized protein [Janthinobacterium agaricidamnosum NBRC 102515 = DSM 9628]